MFAKTISYVRKNDTWWSQTFPLILDLIPSDHKLNTHDDARITSVRAVSLLSCVQVSQKTLISQGNCVVLEIKSENIVERLKRNSFVKYTKTKN